MAVFFDRILDRANDLLALRVGLKGSEVLFERLAGDREAITVEQSLRKQGLHHWHNAADGNQLGHEKTATGLEIGENRHTAANAGEILQCELDSGRVRDGKQVHHGVCGSTEGNDDRDGVLEGFLGDDIRGQDAALEHVQDCGAGVAAIRVLLGRDGVLRRAVWKTEAHRLDRGGHGIGRIHSAAGAWARDGIGLHIVQFFFGDFIGGALTDSLEDGDNIELALGEAAGQDCSAIDEDRRTVHANDRHDAGGHIFVATADGHKSVEALATHDRLDGVGDDLARDERVFHPLGAHRDAIRDRDSIENCPLAARCIDSQCGFAGELVDVHIAGRDHAPGRSDANLGFRKITLLVSDGVEHGTARRPVETIENG